MSASVRASHDIASGKSPSNVLDGRREERELVWGSPVHECKQTDSSPGVLQSRIVPFERCCRVCSLRFQFQVSNRRSLSNCESRESNQRYPTAPKRIGRSHRSKKTATSNVTEPTLKVARDLLLLFLPSFFFSPLHFLVCRCHRASSFSSIDQRLVSGATHRNTIAFGRVASPFAARNANPKER